MLNLFSSKKKRNSPIFDYHIKASQDTLSEYVNVKKEMDEKLPFNIDPAYPYFHFKDTLISLRDCNEAIKATQERIEILHTMKDGKPITQDQLELLMKVIECSKDPVINRYSNIIRNIYKKQ